MTPDEKFLENVEKEAVKDCQRNEWLSHSSVAVNYRIAFRGGADWGREFGRREVIEALRSVNIMNAAVYSETSDRPLIDNRQWADWLESRFVKEKE